MSSPRIHLSRIMGIPQRKQGCFVRKEEMIAVWPKEQLSKANKQNPENNVSKTEIICPVQTKDNKAFFVLRIILQQKRPDIQLCLLLHNGDTCQQIQSTLDHANFFITNSVSTNMISNRVTFRGVSEAQEGGVVSFTHLIPEASRSSK